MFGWGREVPRELVPPIIGGWCHKTCRAPLHFCDKELLGPKWMCQYKKKKKKKIFWLYLVLFDVLCKYEKKFKEKKKTENSESFCESRAQKATNICYLLWHIFIYLRKRQQVLTSIVCSIFHSPSLYSHRNFLSHVITGTWGARGLPAWKFTSQSRNDFIAVLSLTHEILQSV